MTDHAIGPARLGIVTPIPRRRPHKLARETGTLDRLSGGRLVLGVGVGSLQEEFDLLGTPWTDRGARGDDALRALRAALSRPTATYHGEFYDFDDVILEPYAVQDRIPIWVGGRTRRSLRRAVELGDGWAPFGLRLGDITEILTAAGSHDGLEVVLYTPRPIDPLGDPDAARLHADQALALAERMGAVLWLPRARRLLDALSPT
jgi:alkanesulfonate monooxygenase SsuD/methylene tetrahydromethanopterin reductase-like flavin-dependent oxidoreductase (luciferase family)